MIRTTPFHERLTELNDQQLYTHWSGYLSALRFSHAPKHEYFAVRNSAGEIRTDSHTSRQRRYLDYSHHHDL